MTHAPMALSIYFSQAGVLLECMFNSFGKPPNQAGQKMREQLEALESQKSASSADDFIDDTTDGKQPGKGKAAAAKTKPSAKAKPKAASRPDPEPAPEKGEEPSLAARLARLRRVCEQKPSGRCHVPAAVHEKWRKASHAEKLEMCDQLEAVAWDKEGL